MNIQPLSSVIRSAYSALLLLSDLSDFILFVLPLKMPLKKPHPITNWWCILTAFPMTPFTCDELHGAKLFYNDTAVTDVKGTVTKFQGKPFDEGGKYACRDPRAQIL